MLSMIASMFGGQIIFVGPFGYAPLTRLFRQWRLVALGTSRDGGGAAAAARTAQTGFIIAALVAAVGAKLARDIALPFKRQPEAEWRNHIKSVARRRRN